MQQQNLHPLDPIRLFVGQNPAWFLLEVIVRIIIIYLVLMVAMRIMGKRVAAQLSLSELAVIVTLGAAVGVPMQVPDRGLLAPILILAVAIFFQRGLSWWAFRNRKVEVITQGDVSVLIRDGRIFLDALRDAVLSRERLFAQLRSDGVEHLGQIRRVYLETSGDFSVYRSRGEQPGLSILPLSDKPLRESCKTAAGKYACFSCGNLREVDQKPDNECEYCGSTEWTEAVYKLEKMERDEQPRRD